MKETLRDCKCHYTPEKRIVEIVKYKPSYIPPTRWAKKINVVKYLDNNPESFLD